METDIDCKTVRKNTIKMQTLQPAGIYPRMLAHNIDLAITLPLFYLLSIWLGHTLWLDVTCVGIYWLYQTAMEMSPWQGSVGKKVQKMKVTQITGERSTPRQVLIRNFGKILSVASLFVGILWINFDPQRRSWHDKLAGTVVIFSDF